MIKEKDTNIKCEKVIALARMSAKGKGKLYSGDVTLRTLEL